MRLSIFSLSPLSVTRWSWKSDSFASAASSSYGSENRPHCINKTRSAHTSLAFVSASVSSTRQLVVFSSVGAPS